MGGCACAYIGPEGGGPARGGAMKLGVANQWRSQGVCKIRKGSGCRDVLQDVRDLLGLAEVQVMDVLHNCGEDMRGV